MTRQIGLRLRISVGEGWGCFIQQTIPNPSSPAKPHPRVVTFVKPSSVGAWRQPSSFRLKREALFQNVEGRFHDAVELSLEILMIYLHCCGLCVHWAESRVARKGQFSARGTCEQKRKNYSNSTSIGYRCSRSHPLKYSVYSWPKRKRQVEILCLLWGREGKKSCSKYRKYIYAVVACGLCCWGEKL